MNKSTLALTLAISSVLTACGGGGGGSGGGTASSVIPASSSVATVASSSVVSIASSSSVVSVESSAPVSSIASSSSVSSVVPSSSSASSSSSVADLCASFNNVQGFASLDGGTTGGADKGLGNNTVTVTNATELNAALSATNPGYKDKPLIVYVNGLITSASNNEIRVRRSDVSIIGMPNSEFSGVGIRISHGASNIVIRNLLMNKVLQATGAGDHINLDGQDGAVSNIWIDHNEFYNDLTVDKDLYDELVSGRSRVHNVTISHNYFHDSQKTSLWGSSDTAAEEDVGRTISFHHNYWKDVVSRLPLFRFGEGHLWNNYYNGVTGSAINSRMGAKLRIDNNVFENVKNPILSVDSTSIGYWNATGNTFTNVSWGGTSTTACATPPCYAGGNAVTTDYQPPYTYSAQDASTVKAYVMENSGRNKMNACLNLPEVSAASSSQASSSESSSSSSAASTPLVTEDFAAADTTTFFSAAYKTIATDASLPLYLVPAGGSTARITFANGELSMTNTRFTMGDKGGATTSTTQPNGSFDLTKPYRIKFTITAAAGTGNVQVYVDNNTSTSANSIHTTSSSTTVSRLLQISPTAITSFPYEVMIESSVGTANSFIQIRADSSVTNLTIDNLAIEYQ